MQTQGCYARVVVASALGVALLSLLLLPLSSAAQSGGGYDLTWSTIDGGGGISSNGDYMLASTVGQPDAGASSGGGYTLDGGFWGDVGAPHHVYLPIVLR